MTKIAIYLLLAFIWLSGFMTAKVFAGESVIILSDNTIIRTKEGKPTVHKQFEVETVEISDPIADASCFDRAKNHTNRREVYAQLERCL